MVDSPSPPSHNDLVRSSRSRSPSTSSRSSAVRNGTSHHGSTKEYSSSSGGRSSKGYPTKEVLKIVQVANIAPQATREQMQALFGYVGKIDDIRLYPTVDIGLQLQSKICFVKFYDSTSVGSAQHLTNTVFIDRALIVIPFLDGEIPDETRALELLASGSLLPGIADPKLPQHVTSQLEGIPPLQVVATKDPRLTERNLPLYPPLPPTVDQRKIEEIRRTIMVCNISAEVTAQDVMDFFGKAGEVKYFRFCTRDNDPLKFALIEFSEQPSILLALQFNGQFIADKMIRVYHATQAIIKPQAKTNEAAQKEIEEAMSRQAQNLLTHGLDTTGGFNAGKYADVAPSVKDKGRRSRSRSRSHSRRSRSRGRRRSRSRSRRRSSRSRSRRSSSRHRDRYRVKAVKSRSRSRDRRRSRDSKKRSRSRGRSRKSRSRSHSRRSRSRSRKRDDKKKSKKDKERDKDEKREKERSSKDHKENGDEIDVPKESRQKKSDRRSRSPKAESKKRRRSRSHSRKIRSSPLHEKKRSKSKKKKKDNSDREASVDSLVGHSRSSSQEKRSKKESSGDLDYDDKSDISRSHHGDMDMTEA